MITKPQFLSIALNPDLTNSFYGPLVETCEKHDIDTPVRTAAFLAQVMHECNDLRSLHENLNYSAAGLLKTFPKYFTAQTAELYKRQPKKIANRVYANRYGNGDEASGDGWRFCGKGCIQLTFKDNYRAFSEYTGFDFVLHPDWLTLEKWAMAAAGWYWYERKINEVAGDIVAATKRVNGGINGLDDRSKRFNKYIFILNK
jgi:putative chitinase